MTDVTIWHNPRCSKSRQTLALLEAHGHAVTIRRYLDDTPTADELRSTQATLGVPLIEMMRVKEKAFKEAGLHKDSDDARLLAAIADLPILIERPIVFANGKAAIGRPPEAVLDIL